MSENVKKSMEINSLLEETEELSIGAGATAVGKIDLGTRIISSAMPRVSINLSCLTVVTRDYRCLVKPVLK